MKKRLDEIRIYSESSFTLNLMQRSEFYYVDLIYSFVFVFLNRKKRKKRTTSARALLTGLWQKKQCDYSMWHMKSWNETKHGFDAKPNVDGYALKWMRAFFILLYFFSHILRLSFIRSHIYIIKLVTIKRSNCMVARSQYSTCCMHSGKSLTIEWFLCEKFQFGQFVVEHRRQMA